MSSPCPWCNDRAGFISWRDDGDPHHVGAARECSNCGARGPMVLELKRDGKEVDRVGLVRRAERKWDDQPPGEATAATHELIVTGDALARALSAFFLATEHLEPLAQWWAARASISKTAPNSPASRPGPYEGDHHE